MSEALQALHGFAAAAARADFPTFLEYVGVDEQGQRFQRRWLDDFVWHNADQCFETSTPCGLMLPMGAGKTTLACYRAAWEIGRDVNVLIAIVSYSAARAEKLVELVRAILDIPEYRVVFPHVRVSPRGDAADRFTVVRTGRSNNPTVSGHGVLTGTGVRTNFLILDDIVTVKNAILEPANRGRVQDAIRNTWLPRHQLRSAGPRRTVWLQTAYHQADAAAVLRTEPGTPWRWLIVRAQEPYNDLSWEKWEHGECTAEGTIESPFEPEVLIARAAEMGATAAARGLANYPVSGKECPFKEEHFEAPAPLTLEEYRQRVLFADPAGDVTKAKVGDPDWCAVVALGYNRRENCWEVLLARRTRGRPSAQAAFIVDCAERVGVGRIFQEATKDEAMVENTETLLRERGLAISVRPVKPSTAKHLRIVNTLEPALASGTLRICGKMFPEMRNEALAFPVGGHDDLIDALEGAFSNRGSTRTLVVGDPDGWGPGNPADSDHPLHRQWKEEQMWASYQLNDPGEDWF